jgi:tungstate transport system ATP-binding protein
MPEVRPAALTARTAVFRAERASVRFGLHTALNAVSLDIAAGERVALVGGNGSGKTTLLRLLHGLIEPSEGSVLRPARECQAMLFQRPHVLRASALSNVALGPWLRGVPWREARERGRAALLRVDLADVAGRNARALSGGQQQRVALARAWALAPEALLLDEPTASLDPGARREVEASITEFGRQPGMTLVFSSHHLAQVRRLATRVVYLESGRLLADLPVAEFFQGTRLPAEARLFLQGELP